MAANWEVTVSTGLSWPVQRYAHPLAYGHRRREAARRAGLATLPVKVLPLLEDDKMARIIASENFSREDLSPLGEANVVGQLFRALNMSVREIATFIGKNKGWLQNRLDFFMSLRL